jgi:hypothetical protein
LIFYSPFCDNQGLTALQENEMTETLNVFTLFLSENSGRLANGFDLTGPIWSGLVWSIGLDRILS